MVNDGNQHNINVVHIECIIGILLSAELLEMQNIWLDGHTARIYLQVQLLRTATHCIAGPE